MEALIRVLPQLEMRLEKASGVSQAEHKHVTAHGYVSSDANDAVLTAVATSNSSQCSDSSNIIKELNTVKKSKPEEGFHSESSHQLCNYLKHLQHAQLLLVCHRVSVMMCFVTVLCCCLLLLCCCLLLLEVKQLLLLCCCCCLDESADKASIIIVAGVPVA